ncbi:MAG: ABC transporter permease subunit [Saprospiraceae bacterium]|jgi:ABC-2 type transport system permease protein|nr:ABC transporter permease subunit [Saprospiraceae bacterium]
MKPAWIIAKRELNAYFDSLIAYFIIVLFLSFSGFFTWLAGNGDIFFRKQADLNVFFGVAKWTLFFFIPALTMRQLAEEKKTGTIELLLTKAVTDRQVILGKFLSCFLMVAITLALTLPYYITITYLGKVDHGAIWSGYLGLLLLSAAYISIGLFASSITGNQIVAFLLALSIGIFFQFLFEVIAGGMTGFIGELFSTLSLSMHFESISRGVIDTKDLIYFLSIVVLGLYLSEISISKR